MPGRRQGAKIGDLNMAISAEEQTSYRFSEPELISLTAVHPWGPWASRVRTRLSAASLEVSFRNPGPEPLARGPDQRRSGGAL